MGISSYRLWLYFLNSTLIILQILFIHLFWFLWCDGRLKLFPLQKIDILVVFTLFSITLQFFTCCCGILGAYFSNRYAIRLYWLLMVPIIFFDTMQIFLWAYSFACLHEDYSNEMPRLFEDHLITNGADEHLRRLICYEWSSVQEQFSCCAPTIALQNCRVLTSSHCTTSSQTSCHFPLLRWLHSRTDILAILLYCVIYPFKWIVICILREDIHELFNEIYYNDNLAVYRHWVAIEQQESDDSQQTSQLSSPNGCSLASEEGRNGMLLQYK
ncbi:hypothetical protein M3Y97_00238700 [Aphelenchoides bicaudatus]|nr:hypothetical protein M3Y97_00238700 [Aphelenchoides bicaudatus]